MDIHKPKPWHGAREFLKEYLIIVVGVLTALAAEQGVEWLHWRHQAAQAEADLTANLKTDLLNAAERVAVHPCTRARIAELADRLRRSGPAWTGVPLALGPAGMGPGLDNDTDLVMPEVVHTPRRSWSHAAWDSALASGVLSHMPREMVDGYARSFAQVNGLVTFQGEERRIAPELVGLAYDHTLSEAERIKALQALAGFDRLGQATETSVVLLIRDGRRLGLSPPAGELAKVVAQQKQFRGACVRDPAAS
jgi:hypothetical protein